MRRDLAPTEILALSRIVDELDYFQILKVSPGASASEVRKAFHSSSRTFHPDVNRELPQEIRTAVAIIARRVTEAYSVLRDPGRHQAYRQHLESGQGKRMQLVDAQAEAGRQATEHRGRTPQGRQYYNLAEADMRRRDYAAAARNLQMALTFEPDSEFFTAELKEVREKT